MIEEKYESLTELSIKSLNAEYEKCDKLRELLSEFKEVVKIILEKLKTCGVTQDTIHTDIFSIAKKTQK